LRTPMAPELAKKPLFNALAISELYRNSVLPLMRVDTTFTPCNVRKTLKILLSDHLLTSLSTMRIW
jgi:hypothetical protein